MKEYDPMSFNGVAGGYHHLDLSTATEASGVTESNYLRKDAQAISKKVDTIIDYATNKTAHALNTSGKLHTSPIKTLFVMLIVLGGMILIYVMTGCCDHPSCNCIPFNCYNPLKCNGHADWLHRIIRFIRRCLLATIAVGSLNIMLLRDCNNESLLLLCDNNKTLGRTIQISLWVMFGILFTILRHMASDDSCCTKTGRLNDFDDRLTYLRRIGSNSVANRLRSVNNLAVAPSFEPNGDISEDEEEASEREHPQSRTASPISNNAEVDSDAKKSTPLNDSPNAKSLRSV